MKRLGNFCGVGTRKWEGVVGGEAIRLLKAHIIKIHSNRHSGSDLSNWGGLIPPPIFSVVGAKTRFWSIVTLWFWYKNRFRPNAGALGRSECSNKFVSAALTKFFLKPSKSIEIQWKSMNSFVFLLILDGLGKIFVKVADTNLLEHSECLRTPANDVFPVSW